MRRASQGVCSISLQHLVQMNCGRHLCEQRVDGDKIVYLSMGRNWVSMGQCLEESSTDHVQSYTMCTFWIVAFWTPRRGHWP